GLRCASCATKSAPLHLVSRKSPCATKLSVSARSLMAAISSLARHFHPSWPPPAPCLVSQENRHGPSRKSSARFAAILHMPCPTQRPYRKAALHARYTHRRRAITTSRLTLRRNMSAK